MNSFVILFKSLYEEGFARPEGGVRTILDLLRGRYQELGGELRMKRGVKRILHEDGRVTGVEIEKITGADAHSEPLPAGEDAVLEAPIVLSSAGYLETLGLVDGATLPHDDDFPQGKLSYMETILVLDEQPRALGIDQTIVFFNDSEKFSYRAAEDYADLRSGVICASNNFAHKDDVPPEGLLRVTSLASWDKWSALGRPEPYAGMKQVWHDKQVETLLRYVPDVRPRVVFSDCFTPRTVHHFTRHLRGAIYGAPKKVRTGLTPYAGLFICGTDQGFLGIIGSMLSGISIANARVLQGAAQGASNASS